MLGRIAASRVLPLSRIFDKRLQPIAEDRCLEFATPRFPEIEKGHYSFASGKEGIDVWNK
jgi:hypothetical protein